MFPNQKINTDNSLKKTDRYRFSARTWLPVAVALMGMQLLAADAPTGLMCNLLEHPEQTVINKATPDFAWIYNPSFPGDSQKGFQILVSSSRSDAEAGRGDILDSKIVDNSQSINVLFQGTALKPDTCYFWQVRTKDSKGEVSPYSSIQQFKTDTQFASPSSNLIHNTSTNIWANRYPLRYVGHAPVLATNTGSGRWFFDFGQDAFGYAKLEISEAQDGQKIEVRFGELALETAINPTPGGCIRYATNVIVLKKDKRIYELRPPVYKGQTLNPPKDFGVVMPFRYVELTGCGTSQPKVTQERLLSEFNTNAASFKSSNPTLDAIWNLCKNSMQIFTFDGIYIDGDRERKPYEADTYIQQLCSYAVDREFTMTRCSFEYLVEHPTWPTEWKFHMVLVAWNDYLHTGNKDLLLKYYDTLKHDSFVWAATGNGLMQGFPGFPQKTNSDIVDWPAGDRDGFVMMKGPYKNWTNSVNNAFFFQCLQIMAEIATVTGHANDAVDFHSRATNVFEMFNKTFWNEEQHCYVDGVGTQHSSAHANFFPLAFDLVPENRRADVLKFLHERILANHGMPPSVYGAQFFLEGLFKAGDADTALELITTNGPRSWHNMIVSGSTLTTEAWSLADKPNQDWNHAWGAAAGNLIARYVLGLRPLTPGGGQIVIQPQLGKLLTEVNGTIPTIRGPVSIHVKKSDSGTLADVVIPGNVTATILLPAGEKDRVSVDGLLFSGSLSNGLAVIKNTGAGAHQIKIEK